MRKVIDASGMFVYPGFIDSYSHFGLAEIAAIASTSDFREMGKENPELRVVWAINPHSVHFGTGRVTGTTTALVAPAGGTFAGISALVKMDGWTVPEMTFKEAATSFINFPMTPRPVGEGVAVQTEAKEDVTSKLVDKIRDYLKEARRYLELKKLAAGDPGVKAPEYSAKYEALGPVLDGTLPVIISVEKAKDIELAIKFVQDEKLKAIFRGCAQGFKVADKIKQSGIPGDHRQPVHRAVRAGGRVRRSLPERGRTGQGGRPDQLLVGRLPGAGQGPALPCRQGRGLRAAL